MATNKLVTVEQLDRAVDGFAAEVKAADFEKKANLKALAYVDAPGSAHVSSSLSTILAAKMSKTDAQNLVAGEVGMAYRPGGSYAFADLPEPSASNYGVVYHITDDFTTDNRFAEGEGKNFSSGSEVGVIKQEKANESDPDVYIYNVFSGFIDTSKFASQSSFNTFKAALDNLEVATSTDIQNLIDGLSLDEDPAPTPTPVPTLAAGAYDENDNVLFTWDELIPDAIQYGNSMSPDDTIFAGSGSSKITSAKKLVVKGDAKFISSYAFKNLPNLTNVIILDGILSIGDNIFTDDESALGNNNLTSITLPDTLQTIGSYSFIDCPNLATIYYKGTLDDETVKAGSNATVVRV